MLSVWISLAPVPRPFSRPFWTQTLCLARTNLMSRYRNSGAGILWVALAPLASFLIQWSVFSQVIRPEIPDYPLYLISGLLPWMFLSQNLEMGVNLIAFSRGLLRTLPVHPFSLTLALVAENSVSFLLFIGLAFVASLTRADSLLGGAWTLAALVPALIPLLIGSIALTLSLSLLQLRFRDTQFVLPYAINLGYLATPILYPESLAPTWARQWLALNPLYSLVLPIRCALYPERQSQLAEALGPAWLWAGALAAIAAWAWRKSRAEVYLAE